jgi:DNA-binding LytR/AlgR family response regulator
VVLEPAVSLRTPQHLPVQQDGATHLLAPGDVVAVHANAHYTYVFDGTTRLFCPLSISEVEARLDPGRFVRVHRSHIVSLERIASLRRTGDHGIAELTGGGRYTVPVSRSRYSRLKSRLAPGAPSVAAQAAFASTEGLLPQRNVHT